MLVADQLVALAMYEESWTLDVRHHVYIAETIVYQVLECVASLFTHNVSNRHERAHEKQGTRLAK